MFRSLERIGLGKNGWIILLILEVPIYGAALFFTGKGFLKLCKAAGDQLPVLLGYHKMHEAEDRARLKFAGAGLVIAAAGSISSEASAQPRGCRGRISGSRCETSMGMASDRTRTHT